MNQPVGTGTSPTPAISETDFRLSTVSWLQYAAERAGSTLNSGRMERDLYLTYVPFALNAERSVLGQTDELEPEKISGRSLQGEGLTELTTLYVCLTSLGVLRLGRWRMLLSVALRCLSFSRGS